METVRLRVVFDHILSKLQNTQGLKRCWILLKPQHKTISDLSSYLLNAFNLQDHCPHGLLLSMEGFALPDFESTSILKDKDILRVEKNVGVSTEIVMVGDEVNALEVVEFVETRPVASTGMNLLANEEFEKESGGYQSEEEEEEEEEDDLPRQEEETMHAEKAPEAKSVSKKRKATKELKSSKNKKTKSAKAEKLPAVVEDMGNNSSGKQNGTLMTLKVDERSESDEVLSEGKRFSLPQENGAVIIATETKKVPSRSARRKKAKRIWLREKLRAKRKEQQQSQSRKNYNRRSSENDNQRGFQDSARNGNQDVAEVIPARDDEKHQEDDRQPDKDSDLEDDVVPIVIRPGHIRFEPLSKVGTDQAVLRTQIPVETFQWNGIRSKKKGQKWGKEKATSHRSDDYKATSSVRNDYKTVNQERTKMWCTGARTAIDQLDFEKLEFYTTLPKEGDVIAYRLIELSSSWTPELTSYRVGKITQYDMHSNRVRLVQVPKYPVIFEKQMGEDSSSALSETTPYAKDGSLWIEFSSLMEVRCVAQVKSNSVKSDARGTSQISVWDRYNSFHASAQGNRKVDAWEEINQALDAKKAELARVDNWNKAKNSGQRSSWSYNALRGSAMGPTMALLRVQKEL